MIKLTLTGRTKDLAERTGLALSTYKLRGAIKKEQAKIAMVKAATAFKEAGVPIPVVTLKRYGTPKKRKPMAIDTSALDALGLEEKEVKKTED